MDQRQRLIQRELDHELDPGERDAMARLASTDPGFAQARSQARQVNQALSALPPPEPPSADLTERIVRAVMRSTVPPSRWWHPFTRPLRVPAWAAVVLLLGSGSLAWLLATRLEPGARILNRDPEGNCALRPVPMRFSLKASGARSVAVVGDFNGWSASAAPLTDPDGDGLWSSTLFLLPGRYEYKFLVDGQKWEIDREAYAYNMDGFGGRNSILNL